MTSQWIAPPELIANEAVVVVTGDYGLTPGRVKPCVAYLLDGNSSAQGRHNEAFVLGLECRSIGLDQQAAEAVVARWASKISYSHRNAFRAVRDAFKRKPGGEYRYFTPGLVKKPGTVAGQVLAPICADVGCPQNCPPLAGQWQGPRTETFERFCGHGWPAYLKRLRQQRAVDVYRGITVCEQQLGIAPGAELKTTYQQIADIEAIPSKSTVGNSLQALDTLGLIEFTPGGGDGPNARNRYASLVQRVVPIPTPPASQLAAITTGTVTQPYIGTVPQQQRPR